jgi:inorganic triphosphatase YgiF
MDGRPQDCKNSSDEPLPIELEAVFIIACDNQAVIAQRIVELRAVAGFRFFPQADQRIRDEYFDTPDRTLAAGHFGLRVRECGGDRWVTLKAQPAIPESGPVERSELELPWQRRNLHRIVGQLNNYGISLPGRIRRFDGMAPTAVMCDLGLETVQRRTTERTVRHIVSSAANDGTVLAELAVDAVRYHFGNRDVRLYEVEIEATDSKDRDVLVTVGEELTARFHAALRPWGFSKLATGAAIAELDASGLLVEVIAPDDTLTPAAIDRIAEHLARQFPSI